MTGIKLPDGVHRIEMPIPFPLRSVHSYVLETARGFVLVDSGFPSEEAQAVMRLELARICGSLDRIAAVIITHFHPDHSGLAGWLEETAGVRVYVHEKDWVRLEQMLSEEEEPGPDRWAPGLAAMLDPQVTEAWQRMRQDVHRLRFPIAKPTLVSGGEVLDFGDRSLRLIWTPGHTEGHICVLDQGERTLYSGDHLLGRITPHIGVWNDSGDNPLHLYERSLSLVEELAPRLALPAHESLVEDPVRRAQEIREHHQARRRAVVAVLGNGGRTARDVSEAVFPHRQDGMNQFLALSETVAHLQALIEEGAVNVQDVGGQVFYSRR
ncbi:MAG: MBL fold metallo-hydrolase [Dehalococcoidia bacterium]|nr:MBL fold metallo-hydrolase [Dehalococcoidia bacterium]